MNRIKEVLEEKGLKQKWLAEQLGMSNVMINLYSNNKRQPSVNTLIRIGMILNIPIDQLIRKDK